MASPTHQHSYPSADGIASGSLIPRPASPGRRDVSPRAVPDALRANSAPVPSAERRDHFVRPGRRVGAAKRCGIPARWHHAEHNNSPHRRVAMRRSAAGRSYSKGYGSAPPMEPRAPNFGVNIPIDESHATIAEEQIHTARVTAAGCHHDAVPCDVVLAAWRSGVEDVVVAAPDRRPTEQVGRHVNRLVVIVSANPS